MILHENGDTTQWKQLDPVTYTPFFFIFSDVSPELHPTFRQMATAETFA